MAEKDIYQGLSKNQIKALTTEESACNTHWDFLSFSDFCTEEEISSTVGDGKNIYDLNQLIWENSNIK